MKCGNCENPYTKRELDVLKKMDNKELRRIVAFCILMENHEGILGKAPGYIEEKFKKLINGKNELPELMLDSANLRKFNRWVKYWGDR